MFRISYTVYKLKREALLNIFWRASAHHASRVTKFQKSKIIPKECNLYLKEKLEYQTYNYYC